MRAAASPDWIDRPRPELGASPSTFLSPATIEPPRSQAHPGFPESGPEAETGDASSVVTWVGLATWRLTLPSDVPPANDDRSRRRDFRST